MNVGRSREQSTNLRSRLPESHSARKNGSSIYTSLRRHDWSSLSYQAEGKVSQLDQWKTPDVLLGV